VKLKEGDLVTDVKGEVIKEGSVLKIHRIDAVYHLRVSEDKRDTVARVHSFHAEHCPVARTLEGCVQIETRFELVE